MIKITLYDYAPKEMKIPIQVNPDYWNIKQDPVEIRKMRKFD